MIQIGILVTLNLKSHNMKNKLIYLKVNSFLYTGYPKKKDMIFLSLITASHFEIQTFTSYICGPK